MSCYEWYVMSYQGLGCVLISYQLVTGRRLVKVLDLNGHERVHYCASLNDLFDVLDMYQAV